MKILPGRYWRSGFTLLEVAIALLIISLLGSGGILLVGTLFAQERRIETTEYMEEVRLALLTHANITKALPAADIGTDGYADPGQNRGELPSLNLLIRPLDAWGQRLKYQVNIALTNGGTSCNALKEMIKGVPANPAQWPKVWDDDGGPDAANPFPVALILVSAGPKDADQDGSSFDHVDGKGDNRDGDPAYLRRKPDASFDDLVLYIGPHTLYDWMRCN